MSLRDLFSNTQSSLSNISSSLLQLKVQSKFDITAEELRNLMETRGEEAVDKFKQMGSLFGLCAKLKIKPDEGLKIFPLVFLIVNACNAFFFPLKKQNKNNRNRPG